MKELKMVMEEMMNMTDMDMDKSTPAPSRMEDSEKSEDMMVASMLLGKEKMMEMKINRLQKYCFTPTDRDMQAMCAAPDIDMNVFENLELLGHSSHFIRNTLNVTVDVEIQHV